MDVQSTDEKSSSSNSFNFNGHGGLSEGFHTQIVRVKKEKSGGIGVNIVDLPYPNFTDTETEIESGTGLSFINSTTFGMEEDGSCSSDAKDDVASKFVVPKIDKVRGNTHLDQPKRSRRIRQRNATGKPNFRDEEYLIPKYKRLNLKRAIIRCRECPFETTTPAALLKHRKCHGAKSRFACDDCTYSTGSFYGLKRHILSHTDPTSSKPRTKRSSQSTNSIATSTDNSLTARSDRRLSDIQDNQNSGEREQENPLQNDPNNVSVGATMGDGSGPYFISRIKIHNVMSMSKHKPTEADLSDTGILKLNGDSEQGKSAFLLAVMLGFGFDLFLDEGRSELSSICGLGLSNLISSGRKVATIDIILSVSAFPAVEEEFGSHIRFHRRLTRESNPLSDMIVVSSAGSNKKAGLLRLMGKHEMELFLQKLKLTPERLRLMLLDGENVKFMIINNHLWYNLLQVAMSEASDDIDSKRKEVEFLIGLGETTLKCKQFSLQCLKSKLDQWNLRRDIEEGSDLWQLKQKAKQEYDNCREEFTEVMKERRILEEQRVNYQEQLNGNTSAFLNRMRVVFTKFVKAMEYEGDIFVSDERSILMVWIQKPNSREPVPTDVDEAITLWNRMSYPRRQLAVIGLYLALWEISSYLQLVVADAFSNTETAFSIPQKALPVLWDLASDRCVQKKQSIFSYAPSPEK